MAVYLVREVSKAPSDAQASAPAQPVTPAVAREQAPAQVQPPARAVRPSTSDDPYAPRETVVANTPPPRSPPVAEVEPPKAADARALESRLANPKLDAVMAEANKAYDAGEFDEAKQIAHRVLANSPGNVRMLRIVVSAECIAGDPTEAQKYFTQLPEAHRVQMRTRCDRYGVTLKDP